MSRAGVSKLLLVFLLAAFLSAGISAILLVASNEDQSSSRRAQARYELAQYLDSIEPLARQGGRVVALGLKPGISDIRDNDYSPRVLARMASTWLRELRAVNGEWTKAVAPSSVREAHDLCLQALRAYVETARLISVAVQKDRASRTGTLLQAAVRRGEAADAVWDRAAALVQQRRRTLGQNSVSWLPQDNG